MIDPEIFNINADFTSARAAIYVNGKVIIIQRDDKTTISPLMFEFVGGKRDDQESAFQTLQREVKEEVSLDVAKEDIIFAKKYPNPRAPGKFFFFFVIHSLKFKKEDIVFGDEGLGFSLVTPEEFLQMESGVSYQQDMFAEYLKNSKNS